MITKEQIRALIDKGLEEYPSLFLIDFTIGANNHISITLDGDQGVTIEDCVAISRLVERQLDRETEDFSLDVSSYGVFSPLVLERQYIKNIGRTLAVQTQTSSFEGEIEKVENGVLTLFYTTREAKALGKGKVTVEHRDRIPLQDIKEAKLVIKF